MNFVIVTITSTTTVKVAPSELMTRPDTASRRAARAVADVPCESRRSSRRQCLTMPIWPSENDTNTPMMYSWIRVVSFAWKRISTSTAASPRMIMPFEYTSRSPRVLRAFGA